jgi:hypothetical protein
MNLSGLPPIIIHAADHDITRDDALHLWNSTAPFYAKALDHARSSRFRDQL